MILVTGLEALRVSGRLRGTLLIKTPITTTSSSNPNKKQGDDMAGERNQNVQDVFLNHIRKNKVPVTIFLVNGVKLQGIVTWFDNFSVLLRRDAHSQLVYKHAISTVMPATPVQLFDPAREESEASAGGEAA